MDVVILVYESYQANCLRDFTVLNNHNTLQKKGLQGKVKFEILIILQLAKTLVSYCLFENK